MIQGEYIADVYETPYGEYHVHLGVSSEAGTECPIKYMDEEFKEATKEMFTKAHYENQNSQLCLCNCNLIDSDN